MKKITFIILVAFMTISLKAQDKLLSSISESYNNNFWEKSGGINYEYDTNNNLIGEIYFRWEEGAWKIESKTTSDYNSENKETQNLQQSWNTINNLFENSYKSNYTYVGNKLTEVISQGWDNSNWVNLFKSEITTFNINGFPEKGMSYEWNGTQWEISTRFSFIYNSDNLLISDLGENWNGSQWVNDYRTLYTYSNNKLITERDEQWDTLNSIWVSSSNYINYDWDSAGNCKSSKNYTSDNIPNSKDEYSYDTSILMSSLAHPFKDKTGFDFLFAVPLHENKVLTSTYSDYNSDTNDYSNNSRTTYNYESAITLGTETFGLLGAGIQVYPNPAKDLLSIKNESNILIDKIRISDVTGKVILHQNQNTTQINIQNLSKGIYFLELFAGSKKENRKFIKE